MILTRQALSQSSGSDEPVSKPVLVSIEPVSLEDLKKLDEIIQKYPILQDLVKSQAKTIDELKDSLATEKKTNELNQREIYLLNKQHELDQKEIAIERQTSDRLKEVTDRAIKLAEVSKPSAFGNWQLQGLFAVAAYAFGWMTGHR